MKKWVSFAFGPNRENYCRHLPRPTKKPPILPLTLLRCCTPSVSITCARNDGRKTFISNRPAFVKWHLCQHHWNANSIQQSMHEAFGRVKRQRSFQARVGCRLRWSDNLFRKLYIKWCDWQIWSCCLCLSKRHLGLHISLYQRDILRPVRILFFWRFLPLNRSAVAKQNTRQRRCKLRYGFNCFPEYREQRRCLG